MSRPLAAGRRTFARWFAAAAVGLMQGVSPGVGWAQAGPGPPPCRVARLDEERDLITGAQRTLAQINELIALLRTQADDAERRMNDPGALSALAEIYYRRLRSQLRDLEDQRNQVTRLLAEWCEAAPQPQR